ncbi:D-2-hydroxyacid dehydrogenase [Enterovibrio sp. ZSDZ35]|uniref:D-2-hydroxyacid dehydrogenase n=1 Tax=Enterovibrio qingdaonensis TaxID=2899818 RepID=A0ABT5QKW9_9GAMM|nr:D-2-hydroxyacid dehydrogenase [Enterovibrio sp. ZSDZ35]MDD1781630.1 D-2-hydroxyacid dehydrogenase [Enterovibrio sp. ZSDZ35]
MEKIVFLDRATIPAHISLPAPDFDHTWLSYDETSPDDVLERLADATIVITNKVVLSAELLTKLPKLKLIAIAATGYNNVDIDWCHKHGLTVCNIRGYATQSVPEHVMAMAFSLRRNLNAYHRDIELGAWQEKNQFCFFTHPIGDIAGATMGVIGGGSLGKAVAKLASAVGMTVLYAEHKNAKATRDGYTPFDVVLRQADVLTLHCPLNEQTQNLIGTEELSAMKSTAILINTGRGGLVDEVALCEALRKGEIAGAGVDVFTQEPATNTNPLLSHAGLPNLLLTPHVAWGADSSIQALANQLTDNINAFIQGKAQNTL